jgi:hypothetical protein
MTTLFDRVYADTKQAVIDINANETDCYTRFFNGSFELFMIANAGGYSILFDRTNDRMIVAWALRLNGSNTDDTIKGSWGNGYYFMNEGGNDLATRYDLIKVVDLFINKALKG